MKKIVALVLSLVMVLGLCATANAAVPAYLTTDVDGLSIQSDLSKYSFELKKQVDEIAISDTFAKYVVWQTEYETKGVSVGDKYYTLAASKESADAAFVEGNKITYLYNVTSDATWDQEVYLVPTVDMEDVAKCGDVFVVGDYALYKNAQQASFVEDKNGTTIGYVDGKALKLSDAVNGCDFYMDEFEDEYEAGNLTTDKAIYNIEHTYDYDVKTIGADETVTRVYCTECKAELKFVTSATTAHTTALTTFGAGNYVYAFYTGENYVWVAKDGAELPSTPAVDAPATDKVESAETFDAGIAMYVGMSVLAATGSAVVLKKKD